MKSAGHKWWRFKYRFGGRADGKPGKAEKVLALGVYPEGLAEACQGEARRARRLLADGIDPGAERKAAEETQRLAHLGTFEAVAREWLKRQSWGESHGAKNIRRLEQHVFPWIGQHAIANVKRADIRGVLRRIEGTGSIETAYRVLQLCRAIFEYAIAEEICEHTPCNGLSKTLLPRSKRHHASITDPKKVGELMRAIDGFSGTLRSPALCAWLRCCLCGRTSCGRLTGRNSTSTAHIPSGGYRRRE